MSMAKSTRIKADPLVIGSLERAESAMMELASLTRKQRAITDALNERVDGLKEAAKGELEPLDRQKKALSDALGTFLKMNRKDVLKDRKSIDLAFGVMGFRASSALCQMKGISAEMTLQRLKEHGLQDGIRLKEELDKDVMRGWPEERLHIVGLVRQEKDQFFIELKEETLGNGTA